MEQQEGRADGDVVVPSIDQPEPRNIILCADGTGNRAGVTPDTNVWRLFQGIDHRSSDASGNPLTEQLQFYTDGVGTSDNVLFKAVGGAFGVGLNANIRAAKA